MFSISGRQIERALFKSIYFFTFPAIFTLQRNEESFSVPNCQTLSAVSSAKALPSTPFPSANANIFPPESLESQSNNLITS